MSTKYLDDTGLTYFWGKIKTYVTNAVKVTGVKGNAESSYRTGNVNLTAANIGAIAKNETGNTQQLVRPSNLNGCNDKTIDAKINTLRANRLAFLPADQIIIEKTTDGGTTWVDAGISDATKVGLFSETRAGVSIPLLNGVRSLQCGLRITFTAMKYNVPSGTAETAKYNYWSSSNVVSTERYNQIKEMYFWVTAVNDTISVKLQRATGANPNTWNTAFEKTDWGMTGWSSNDYISFGQNVFGGGTTQTSNYWNYRLTFMTRGANGGTTMATTSTTSAQSIMEIRGYGDTWWTAGNEYAANDKIFTHDYQKNVTFPNKITATGGFVGNVTGNATSVNNHTVGVDVPSNAVFTDTVTTVSTTGSGNAVTAISASNGALTVTKGTTFLTSHQDISGKADKSATVSTVTWDSTNKKLTKTIDGTTTDVVTAATLRTGLNVADGAEVNQNAFSNVKVGSTTVAADSKTDTLELVAGSNVTLTPDATNDKVTIAATDTTYSDATTSTHGLMSTADKTKLDGISGSTLDIVAGSNVTVTPNTTAGTLTIAATDTTYSDATTSTHGLMSASDKTKLNGIDMSTKQDTLVSGTNIKTINNTSLLGSGNITISGGDSGSTTPTANTVSKWDASKHMNSEDMTSAAITSFVNGINTSAHSLVDTFYPVGSYYETSDSTFNPNTAWGGTWSLETAGQVHVSAGTGYTIGSTGGEATHTLTTDEMPSHSHTFGLSASATVPQGSYYGIKVADTSSATSSVGGGQAHNNMQPYIVVNRWHRTA